MENGEVEAENEEYTGRIGRHYRPVSPYDRPVVELSSLPPESNKSDDSIKRIKILESSHGTNEKDQGPSSPTREIFDRTGREFKLELFGLDTLVDKLGLRSMAGQQAPPRANVVDGENVSITLGRPKEKDVKLGTLMGVFLPCLQNILGIIFYIRFTWIVGIAGIGGSLLLVSLCCLCTFLTAISLSAIATNGAMKGGGPYYLIGRALGPEVGVSIGLCFFLGNAIAGALYILGAVETFLDAVPSAGIFKESATSLNATSIPGAPAGTTILSPSLHDLQLYGVVVTILLCFVVFGGVKMINRVAPAFLVPVLLSLFCIFIGIFASPGHHDKSKITGLRWHTFKSNWHSEYQRTNRAGIPAEDGIIYWDFSALLGLFFPAVTGIMAGSNRSASLRDTQRSIPIGTLSAIATTTAMYLISVLLFGAVATREGLLTDRL